MNVFMIFLQRVICLNFCGVFWRMDILDLDFCVYLTNPFLESKTHW